MDPETFKASRWTHGNHFFPTVIEVTDRAVMRHKRSWFSKDEISISISKVASVHIKTGIIWSDILIESTGGSDPLASHGHKKADARRIRDLVEMAQGDLSGPEKLKLS
jgi:Bacterial PH domain